MIRAAKRVKGDKGAKGKGGGGAGGNGAAKQFKSPGQVKEGAAYEQETRKIILSMDKVSKVSPSGKPILNGVGLGMYLGAKIAVLGANGAGKSTLMRMLAGKDDQFDGELRREPGITVAHLEQEPPLDDGPTVDDNIQPAVERVRSMVGEFEQVSMQLGEPDADVDALMAKMDRLQTAIDACNGWEIDRQVQRATDALRCPPGDALVEHLSGGERRRVAIARVLLEAPDILLLDEPTNHLDAESVAWLEKTLNVFPGTVVGITHDRYFLDQVAGWILELDRGKGIPFEGNYSAWLEAKNKRLSAESKSQAALQRQIAGELEWLQQSAKGQQKKGKARLRRYDDLVEEAKSFNGADASIDSIQIPVGPRLGNEVVECAGLSKGYGDRLLIDNASFSIPQGAIVGIIGGNGAGKTTLFRMILGREEPDSGSVTVGETVVPMWVEQDRDLSSDKTVFEEVGEGADVISINGREISLRAYCSQFNFKGSDQQKKVGVLSGGERNRLQLAKVLKQNGNLLMLDEPTNDADVDLLRALENAINQWPGTVLCISHDRYFLDRICSHILAFEGDSQVVFFEGSYSEYAADLRRRNGGKDPTRVKYRKMAMA